MPSARLITRAIEEADDLAADLRTRGFAVEVVSPDDIPLHRVDLEVRLEEGSTEQALRSAEELSKTEDIHVFIAPGAIVESLRPMISVPLEIATVETPASVTPEGSVAALEAAGELREFAFTNDENAVEEVFAEAMPEVAETLAQSESYAHEPVEAFSPSSDLQSLGIFAQEEQVAAEIPLSEDAVLEEISAAQEEPVEQSHSYDFESQETLPVVSETQPVDTFQWKDQVAESQNAGDSTLGEEIFAQEGEPSLPTSETTLEQTPSYAMESHEAFPPSDWPIWQPLAEEDEAELATVAAPEAAMASRSPRSVGTFTRARNNDRLFWRLAIVASVVAVSTMLLGVSAHRFSPIPRGLAADDGSLPFKSKTASANSQTVADASPQAVAAGPTPEFKQVLVHMPAVDRPSPAERLGNRVEHPKRYQRAATRHEDAFVAKDTVVRFGKKPVTARMEPPKKSGIRHYSDLR